MIRALLTAIALFISAPAPAQVPQFTPPAWATNATIYEVNVRQYSRDGTLAAVTRDLPRLARMGVKILWIMPVQPIGEKNRKGTLGSYYSIRDYKGINPEFGTHDDFNALVRRAHALGMKVILDWVANHTAWDHPWVAAHPDWYQRLPDGTLTGYRFDNGKEIEEWTDVVGLDYRRPGVADAMIDAMRFWVTRHGIDGFRADVASLVPLAFWQRARGELDAIKPLFWLAESNDPVIHGAFDMSYDWKLLDALVAVGRGQGSAEGVRQWVRTGQAGFPPAAWRMIFTTNHDVNSWRHSDADVYGANFPAYAVLAAALPGMPLVYNGQESGLAKKIAFFERDPIDWGTRRHQALYTRLLNLKRRHPAMANGAGPATLIDSGDPNVVAFRRSAGRRSVTVAVNLADAPARLNGTGGLSGTLTGWGWRIVER